MGWSDKKLSKNEMNSGTAQSNTFNTDTEGAMSPYSVLPSIRTVPVSGHLKHKTQFLMRPFQLSVNEVFRMKAEHFSFKMKVLAS